MRNRRIQTRIIFITCQSRSKLSIIIIDTYTKDEESCNQKSLSENESLSLIFMSLPQIALLLIPTDSIM